MGDHDLDRDLHANDPSWPNDKHASETAGAGAGALGGAIVGGAVGAGAGAGAGEKTEEKAKYGTTNDDWRDRNPNG